MNLTHSFLLVFVCSLEHEFAGLKRRRTSLQASVNTQSVEVVKAVQKSTSLSHTTVTVSSSVEETRSNPLTKRVDRLIADLLQLEKEVIKRLRAPLSQADHTGDLAGRIRDHEVRCWIYCCHTLKLLSLKFLKYLKYMAEATLYDQTYVDTWPSHPYVVLPITAATILVICWNTPL